MLECYLYEGIYLYLYFKNINVHVNVYEIIFDVFIELLCVSNN